MVLAGEMLKINYLKLVNKDIDPVRNRYEELLNDRRFN